MRITDEKIAKFTLIISIAGIFLGIVFGILNAFLKLPILDFVAGIGLTFIVFPFLILQIAMFANYKKCNIKTLGWETALFFMIILFPLANIWFTTGICSVFQVLPDFRLAGSLGEASLIRAENMYSIIFYSLILYLSLTVVALFLRLTTISKVIKSV